MYFKCTQLWLITNFLICLPYETFVSFCFSIALFFTLWMFFTWKLFIKTLFNRRLKENIFVMLKKWVLFPFWPLSSIMNLLFCYYRNFKPLNVNVQKHRTHRGTWDFKLGFEGVFSFSVEYSRLLFRNLDK